MPVILAVAVAVAAFLIAPVIVVVPMSFTAAQSMQFPPPAYSLALYRNYFSDPEWLLPTVNSIAIAAGTMVLTLCLAIPAGFGLLRSRIRARAGIDVLLMSPVMVPLILSALAYYRFLAPLGLVGTRFGVMLAHTALALPVTLLTLSAGFKSFDRNLVRAAMSAGAGPLRTFLFVTFPVLRPTILVGALFAFLSSFDETVVALFIAGRDATTLPKKMFQSIRLEADPVISVVSTLLFALVLVILATTALLRRRNQPHAA